MDSLRVLVITLSVTLAVLLICSIILVVKTIQLVNFIKKITERANAVMDDVEAVGDFFRKSAGPLAIGNIVGNIVDNFKKGKHGKGR